MLFSKPLTSHCGAATVLTSVVSLSHSSAPEFLAQACFQAASEARPQHLHPTETLETINLCTMTLQAANFQRCRCVFHQHEWNCSLSSFSCCWWSLSSGVSRLLSLLRSVTLLSGLLSLGQPVCQLLHCPTVLFKAPDCKMYNVFICFLCISCMKGFINLLQHSAI